MIDEALSTPDNTLDFSTSSPTPHFDSGGSSKVTSDGKKFHSHTTTVSEMNRYIPTNTTTSRNAAGYVASADYSRGKPDSKTGLPYSGTGATTVETGLTSLTTSTHTVTTATVSSSSSSYKTNPWSRGHDIAGATVTTVTNSSSQSDSPVHEELSLATPSLLSSPAVWESDEDSKEVTDAGTSSLSQTSNELRAPHSATLGVVGGVSVTPEPGSVNLNEEFPPLSKHGRSQSDPQVSAERQQAQQDSKASQTGNNVSRLTQSLTSQVLEGSHLKKPSLSSSFTPSVPPIEGSPVSSKEREKVPKMNQSTSPGPEKLPFASPSRRNQSDPSVLSISKSGSELEQTPGSRVGRSGSEDGLVSSKVPTSLAVGADVENKVRKIYLLTLYCTQAQCVIY